MSLRKLGIVVLLIGALAVGVYASKHRGKTSSPSTTKGSFVVHRTTTLQKGAGSLTLRFTPSLKTVIAAQATTDKAYFSLTCAGRSAPLRVPGNGQMVSMACRLVEVRYSDNSASSGITILHPRP